MVLVVFQVDTLATFDPCWNDIVMLHSSNRVIFRRLSKLCEDYRGYRIIVFVQGLMQQVERQLLETRQRLDHTQESGIPRVLTKQPNISQVEDS